LKLVNRDFSKLKNTIKDAFKKVKEEFDDHRESINRNTNEIQANYEYLCQLDSKIEKLSERIDELSMFLQYDKPEKHYEISGLTTREKEVFLVLYTDGREMGYKEIARKTGLTENLVICYVANLMTKGVPILRKHKNNELVLILDPDFKEYQMKENIVGIDESISKGLVV